MFDEFVNVKGDGILSPQNTNMKENNKQLLDNINDKIKGRAFIHSCNARSLELPHDTIPSCLKFSLI